MLDERPVRPLRSVERGLVTQQMYAVLPELRLVTAFIIGHLFLFRAGDDVNTHNRHTGLHRYYLALLMVGDHLIGPLLDKDYDLASTFKMPIAPR